MLTVTRGLSNARPRPYPVATIGNFDGHHLGHRALLDTVVRAARHAGGTAVVLTFDPHPVRILAPQVDLRFLTSPEEKLAHFEAAGVDEVVFLEFTSALAGMAPEEFARMVLHERLGVAEVYVGGHFRFGKGRSGRIADLQRLGAQYGFAVHPVPPVMLDGAVVSSTRIRQSILAGEMDRAAALLGRAYAISGQVIRGEQRGQSLGWPTANLPIPAQRVIPPDGVYAARAGTEGALHDAVAYIGTRPTFGAGERLIEVNMFDQSAVLYGQTMTVEFVERLRGDLVFASAEELSAQIARDVGRAKALLREPSQGVP
ncbi:MAG TPA: bifunctional riboflavin kinase/FAD synthetase [Nitrospira sp.]|nr:bifunctional riboflavin kinase/FAD synthetase [Nitrospira sp.]